MKRKFILCILVLIWAGGCRTTPWLPASGPLETPWTSEVSPDRVWPQYPRPHMVRENWINLNGLWDYAIVDQDANQPASWDGQILVPFAVESALSGVKKAVRPDQRLWYRRFFSKPGLKPDQRLLLHFGAVDWQCTVWVNGSKAGEHTGGYDPFTFDITEQLRAGKNELIVAVWDPTDTGYQPRGKQVLEPEGIMYTAVTGIWQTVWLEPVHRVHVDTLTLTPNYDASLLGVKALVYGAGQDYHLEYEVKDSSESVAKISTGVIGGSDGWTTPFAVNTDISIPNAKDWTPESPFLYDVKLSLFADDRLVDQVSSYFGMRKIEVGADEQGALRLKLNNDVLFQYGPLDQGWWPDGLYTPPTDEAIQYDIAMTKKFGMNMARKHVKYECARWYYWCDKMGLLVWQDMPSGDSARSQESKANFRRELKAMIDALHHFPCIVMWVPFNEGWGQFDTPEIVQWIQAYDPTRPVNEASGWHDRGSGGISDSHSYPGPAMRPVEEDRAVVLGEFGGLGMPVQGHTWQEQENWGYVSYQSEAELTNAYVDLLKQMRPLIGQGLSAAVYTQTSDVEIEVNGLLTYDRQVVKMDLEPCAAAARTLYRTPPRVTTLVPTSQYTEQVWHYTTDRPEDSWLASGFDDSDWQTGPGGFGTKETPGAVVGTVWDGADIWLRRTFILDGIPQGDLSLIVHHDEDAEIYINGKLIRNFTGFVTSYQFVSLTQDVLQVLKPGDNTLAVHCRQSGGGQYIDVGLILIQEP